MARNNKKEETLVSKWTLLSAFIMLLVTITALTTATYAWFTANTTIDLGDLDVNVTASSGIQVSMDALTWKAGLTTADILAGHYFDTNATRLDKNQIPSVLSAVSTAGLRDVDNRILFYKGEVTRDESTNNFVLGSTATAEVAGTRPLAAEARDTGDFITFDMFIQTAAETQLLLTAASDVTNTMGNTGLQNAARVAFVYLGTATTPEDARVLTGAAGDYPASFALKQIIWEPNASSHTQTGINNASSTYGITAVDDSAATSAGEATLNSVMPHYYGLKTAFTTAALNATDDANFGQVTPTIQTTTAQVANSDLFTIPVGISKVRVYCWIEGQDVDCEDNVSGSSIKFDMAITKPQPENP